MKARRTWLLRAGVAAVAAAAVAVALVMVRGAGATSYRLQQAGIGDVTEQVTTTGTVEATNQADANFSVSGTVASVAVAVGDHVSAGQRLAELDTTTLEVAVQQAQADLAVAQVQLTSAERAATSTTTTSTTTTTTNPCRSHTPSSASGAGSQGTGSSGEGGSPGGSSGGKSPPTSSTTTSTTSTTTTLPSSSSCSNPNSSGDPSDGDPSDPSSSGSLGTEGTNPSASSNPQALVDQDEVSVYQDEGDLDTAEQNLAAATLTAPISGTVYQVSIAPGDQVSSGLSEAVSPVSAAGSSSSGSSGSSAAVAIVDTGGYEVVCDVTPADIAEMSYGDSAVATLASAGQASGVVTSITAVPTSSDGSTYFPVAVTVQGDPGHLYSGTDANVTIVVARRLGVLTVPTSAVHTNGRTSSVSVLVNGHEVKRHIDVGVVGPTRTQIVSGLAAGQEVVLAEEDQPVPTSTVPGGGTGVGFVQFGGPAFAGGG